MTQRDRSFVTTADSGWRRRFNETVAFGQVLDYSSSITDFVDPGDCKILSIAKRTHAGGRFNKSGTGNLSAIFNNYLGDRYRNDIGAGTPGHSALVGDLSDTAYATQAAARTNPSRPYVDVPVNVLQIGELAHLIRKRGRNLFQELGRENLRYQFAIKPLVGDLIKLLDFAEQVERRVQEIERLFGGRGLRRTIPLGKIATLQGQANGTEIVQSAGGLSSGQVAWQSVTVCDIGAHVRWKPYGGIKHLSPGEMRMLARRAVLGLTGDLSTLWEVIPWSWLIDWGTTIGTYLKANRNIIPATLVNVSVMRHTTTTRTWAAKSGSDWTLTSFVSKYETKKRDNVTIAPTAHWPFLSANQMGILASLAVTRM